MSKRPVLDGIKKRMTKGKDFQLSEPSIFNQQESIFHKINRIPRKDLQ